MDDDEGQDALIEVAAEERFATRLQALALYAELRERWLRGETQPGDRGRHVALRAVLERTGGVPHELRWPWPAETEG